MATSGTIGTTTINTAKLLEKAIRRCGLSPQALTPETVETAKEDLYMLLLSLTNRGLNLWCIDRKVLPLKEGQATYVLPVGTLSILNLLHSNSVRPDYTAVDTITEYTATVDASVVRYGVKFSVQPTLPVVFEYSSDAGVTWNTVKSIAVSELNAVGYYTWFDTPAILTGNMFRLSSVTGTVTDLFLSTNNREIVTSPFNRDDYANQPNKNSQSSTVTNYYFEKLVDPQVTVWPVPVTDTSQLVLFRHRQLQDIGTLTDTLELPARWYESITWQLAMRLSFELPGIDPARRAEVIQMAGTMVMEVESGETDNAPIYFQPAIGVYTR